MKLSPKKVAVNLVQEHLLAPPVLGNGDHDLIAPAKRGLQHSAKEKLARSFDTTQGKSQKPVSKDRK